MTPAPGRGEDDAMAMVLVVAVFLPLAGAVLLFANPGLDHRTARSIALGVVLATLALALVLAAAFDPGYTGPQFARVVEVVSADGAVAVEGADPATREYGRRWIDVGGGPGIRFALGLDGISLALFVLTAVLMVPSVFASWESVKERPAAHYALMLLLATGLLGLFASLDVVLFYIFFEFTLIPLFFLIGLYGGPERRRASVMFFLYTLAGSLLTLVGVIALVVIHQQHSSDHVLTFSIPHLTEGLRRLDWGPWSLEQTTSWLSPQALIFLLLFAGFAIKVPLFPFHTWLPLAHVEAPTAGSILLAGVLLKVGGYGLLRFNLGMTPLGAYHFMPLLAWLSVIGIIYGALTALAQTDVKRLVAYSSVSHMGFVTLGLFSLQPVGLDGATIQMVNHGLTTGALFACVGVLYERYHTREMTELGGLWSRLPLLAFFLILASLGSAAVPGLNGFVGEFPILLGQFATDPFFAVIACAGMVLGAYYLLVMLERVVFGPLREPGGHGHEHEHAHATSHETEAAGEAPVRPVAWHEIAGLAPLMALIVLIGVYPKPIFDRIGPPLRQIGSGLPVPAGAGASALESAGRRGGDPREAPAIARVAPATTAAASDTNQERFR
jgi:NADH-quinone oxidoreductase subunit M